MPVHRSGARSGIWPVVADRVGADSVIYSFGVGDNIAWELDMIAEFGVTVHAFDPTPQSIAWVAEQGDLDGFEFHRVGLADHDGVGRFKPPAKAGRFNYVSDHPGLELEPGSFVECPVRKLGGLRADLGHDRIDVLKIDIEGGEYAVLTDVIAELPEQLLIEFHHDMPSIGFPRTQAALAELRHAGYRIFDISRRGLEFGFVRDASTR